MKIFTTKNALQQHLQQLRQQGSSIGYVATMGALHDGHLSLLAQAKQQADVTICSIFVNPTQFNDPADLERYPRPIAADTAKLERAECDILFNPPVGEMYAGNENWHLDIGPLEHLLEGEFRPGHYQGVTQVVFKLFDIIQPNLAFFGQKDYQQVMVIRKMVQLLNLPVKVIMCPILRETDGLAMSSRNIHLSTADHEHALVLWQALNRAKSYFEEGMPIAQIEEKAAAMISHEPGTQLEYFTLADGDTLEHAEPHSTSIVALVAARVGSTRLIDNVIIR
ncbi:pantoate--beta-alanine ligase [Mucilaginibacter daejeonensis]|uniref:pantoate--beta-alanine ligase n=1 Tax=Mucilaginibacter daejeonensis TaxID=398049 RepID=UPI001D173F0C|nr:pantoate--beta-alanine ligase [Mucilaginibacter daejeonensis]UEG54049.1 pantoate--beta-alanine ligase [Mucilaginibacter daejeonensis]